MLLPVLDKRLATAYELYPVCEIGADIGADHGLLPLHLLAKNRCQEMIVTDISEKALAKGEKLIQKHGFSSRASFFLGDGLLPVPYKVQAISMLGMGGNTLCQILTSAPNKLHGATLILSAHNHMQEVRRILPTLGYGISQERVVKAAGRFYAFIKALPGNSSYNEKEIFLGPKLLENKTSDVLAYWQWQHHVYTKALKEQKQSLHFPESFALFNHYLHMLEEEMF